MSPPPYRTPRCHGAQGLSSLRHTAHSHWLSRLHTVVYTRFSEHVCYATQHIQCVCMLPSPFAPLLPPLFLRPVSPFLPFKQVHQYHLSRFHVYALIYDICFSDLLLSVGKALGLSLSERAQLPSFFIAE